MTRSKHRRSLNLTDDSVRELFHTNKTSVLVKAKGDRPMLRSVLAGLEAHQFFEIWAEDEDEFLDQRMGTGIAFLTTTGIAFRATTPADGNFNVYLDNFVSGITIKSWRPASKMNIRDSRWALLVEKVESVMCNNVEYWCVHVTGAHITCGD